MTGHAGDVIVTDGDGRFELADVAPGRRSLVVEHPAFVTRQESGLELVAGERRHVDVTLTPLSAGETAKPGARPVEFAGIGAALSIRPEGVVISDLVAGGPAERAGLARGDLVLTIQGSSVTGRTLGDITEDIRGVAGTTVRLEISRGGRSSVLEVVRGNVRFGG
jgi:S1-C subfamily serine protease